MTCEDCIYYDICLTAFSSRGMYLGDDAEKMECFKNKADYVEVVRCKDCIYCDLECRCEAPENGLMRDFVRPNDFCSYGERK